MGPLSKRVDATMTSFLEPSAAPQIRKSDQPGTSIKDGCNLFTGSQSLHSTPPSSSLSPPTSYLSHFIFTTPLHSHERPVSVSVQLIVIKCNMQLLRQRGRKIVRFTGHCLLFKVESTIKYRETNIVVNQHFVGDDITSQS